MSFSYILGTKFCDVCKELRINEHDKNVIWRVLIEEEGYTERALCFVASKCENKLTRFIGDSRFASVFINEVRKNAFKPDDPRWKQ